MLNNREIKCVIFDCDGVLINSEVLCCKALFNVFSLYGSNLPLNDYIANFKGGKVSDILSDTIEHLGIRVRQSDIEPLYRDQVDALFSKELRPLNGVESLLDKLSAQAMDFCVVSNSHKEKVENSLRLAGLLQQFNGRIFSAYDVDSWKPEPDILLYAAMSMGYPPHECVYVDDSDKGIKAGLKAGIETIHLRSDLKSSRMVSENVLRIEAISQLDHIIF